jgi:c-di-GMP-binding flagellar brake protein YcgR
MTAFEKRQHARTACEIESSFRRLDQASQGTAETTVQDISEGGIRFRANNFIPVRDRLLFRINIPNHKTIEAVAEPAWIREIPSVSQYDIGARFISLSEADQEIIRRFVQSPRPAV